VVIEGDTATHFAVQLPLSSDFQQLAGTGTRHAAALGLAELSDALCLVVSEERGQISLARAAVSSATSRRRRWRDPPRAPRAAVARAERAPHVAGDGAEELGREARRPDHRRQPLVPLRARRAADDRHVSRPRVGGEPARGYVLETVTPTEVWVTLAGPARAFYFFDPNQLEVTGGRGAGGPRAADVSKCRSATCAIRATSGFERVDPEAVKISVRPLNRFDTPERGVLAAESAMRRGFSHIGLSTLDLDRTRAFYEGRPRHAGRSLRHDRGEGGRAHPPHLLRCGRGAADRLHEPGGVAGIPAEYDAGINRGLGVPDAFYHLAFEVGSVEALEARRADLIVHGVAVSPVVDHGWMKSIYFKDPNGLMLEFACTTRQLGAEDDTKMQVRFQAKFSDLELSRHFRTR
jgi:catechol 2,3-dioxygenase-like lactoylglutathione lyase family enzyme